MIEIDHVTFLYPVPRRFQDLVLRPFTQKTFKALSDFSLSIPAGQSLGILGANGAGKTTLLKLIGGLLYPTRGAVKVDGFNVVGQNSEVRKRVGLVLNEERSFFWRLTGRQNLRFFGTLDDLAGRKLEERIDELLVLVGLEHGGDRRVAGYSSGMRQRLAIARGLLADPDVLILDEPTRAIDPISASQLHELVLRKLRVEQNKTLIIATHQLSEADLLCDRFCVIAKGEILSVEEKAAVKARFESVDQYFRAAVAQPGQACQPSAPEL